jgi:hypothetical protein
VVARILLWSLADSKSTLAELREHLPELPAGDVWISNEPQERFGLISFAETLPDVSRVVELIGSEPQVGEEFDVE